MAFKDLEAATKSWRHHRITPRTCLWPLTFSVLITFGLSIGLTFRSNHHCYAGTCGEWLFPLQARLHVIIWYSWLYLSTGFLAVRAFHPEMQKVLAKHLTARKMPVIGKSLSIGGLGMICWVICLYGTIIGVWWPRLHDYFTVRNADAGIQKGSGRLAAIALTGHFCDVTMGMALLPISRHSALASFFMISTSTTLTNHMLAAYFLFMLVIIHGLLYVSWIPVFNSLSSSLQQIIPVLNPTYLYQETWPGNASSIGIWRSSLIFTGSLAALIMAALFVTTLPGLRQKHFNLFYFTHLLSIVMVIIICLHASTMFYCTSPGLAMWVLDWGMRLYELRRSLRGSIKALGRGWYCVTLGLPRARLSGCSCRSPLAHFYLHHSGSSIRELHPFTTITHLASTDATTEAANAELPIQFLFRKSGKAPATDGVVKDTRLLPLWRRALRGKKQRIQSVQWTAKLAYLADEKKPEVQIQQRQKSEDPEEEYAFTTNEDDIGISLRLEGPYFTPADPHRYDTVVCMVAGTGISGALAIASAFINTSPAPPSPPDSSAKAESSTSPRWCRCIIIWSIKASDYIDLPLPSSYEGLDVRSFLTGEGRARVDLSNELEASLDQNKAGRTWAYISGPKAFITAGKEACKRVQMSVGRERLDFYAASWDP